MTCAAVAVPVSPFSLNEFPGYDECSSFLTMASDGPGEVAPTFDVDPELSAPWCSCFEPEGGHDSALGLAAHDVVANHADRCEVRHDQPPVGPVPGSRIWPSGADRFCSRGWRRPFLG